MAEPFEVYKKKMVNEEHAEKPLSEQFKITATLIKIP
jgi:hypothetical protein